MATLAAKLKKLPLIKLDRAWVAVVAILLLLAALAPGQFVPALRFIAEQLIGTAPFLIFAVLTVAYLKASGAETVIARAFAGRETRMIFFAALIGGLAPFCSCEVVPFIAGLLALGTPLSAVMAFWLSSPLIDPPAFLITAGALGWKFAVAKTIAAVGMGLIGGFAVKAAAALGYFDNPLRPGGIGGNCGCPPSSFEGRPAWRFWESPERRNVFWSEGRANARFLIKWLTLAFLLESLMITYVPAESIAKVLGGTGIGPIMLSAIIGAPAYLNSYAAPPLVAGMMTQGMSAGAAMAFMVAGAVSCIPAMTAVFALVRRPVFAAYLGLGFAGAVLSGLAYGAVAGF